MDRQLPLAAIGFKRRANRPVGIELLAQRGGEMARGGFIAGEARDGRRHGSFTAVGETAGNGYVVRMAPDAASDGLALANRDGWPDDLCLLLSRYPREQWQAHANLGEMARFWLSRHAMFRELGAMIGTIEREFREGRMPPDAFAQAFVPRLRFLLSQLDVHHQIEDYHYFPIFRAAETRLARGFDVLEGDHHAIHADMARVAETANALLRALSGPPDASQSRADDYAAASGALIKGLMRHLDDEEDLIVPLILDRGEEALGVAHR